MPCIRKNVTENIKEIEIVSKRLLWRFIQNPYTIRKTQNPDSHMERPRCTSLETANVNSSPTGASYIWHLRAGLHHYTVFMSSLNA